MTLRRFHAPALLRNLLLSQQYMKPLSKYAFTIFIPSHESCGSTPFDIREVHPCLLFACARAALEIGHLSRCTSRPFFWRKFKKRLYLTCCVLTVGFFFCVFRQILTLEERVDTSGETQEERQGKMLLHTEYSLLSLLHNQDGVVHHHGLFQVCPVSPQ